MGRKYMVFRKAEWEPLPDNDSVRHVRTGQIMDGRLFVMNARCERNEQNILIEIEQKHGA